VLLAAYLRLYRLDVSEFKRDEAMWSMSALEMARGQTFPLLGPPSSIGVPHAPFSVYIISIPYHFSSDPLIASYFLALINLMTVVGVWKIGRDYGGPAAGWLAGFGYAVNFWAVTFSRKMWSPDLMPPLIVLTVFVGLRAFINGRRWAQWLYLPLLVVALQIHYGSVVLLPISLWLIVTAPPSARRGTLAGLPLTFALLLPFMIGWAQSGLFDPRTLADALRGGTTGEERSTAWTPIGLDYARWMIAGSDLHALAGPERFEEFLVSIPDAYPLLDLIPVTVALLALLLLLRVRTMTHKQARVAVVLLLWLALLPVVFSLNLFEPFSHYYIAMLPAAFLVFGFGVTQLLRARSRIAVGIGTGAAALLSLYIVLQIWLGTALIDFVSHRATPGGFGTPLTYLRQVRAAVLDLQPAQVLIDLDGQVYGESMDATVWMFLLADVPDVRLADALTEVYPAGEAVLLTTCGAAGSSNALQIPMRPQPDGEPERCYEVSVRQPDHLDRSAFTPIETPARFANGVELQAASWDEQCLHLLWQIETTTTVNYSFAVHFFDAGDNRITQADNLSWLGQYWRPGDRVIRQFCLAEARHDVHSAQIGMYTYDGVNFFNVDLMDAMNAPAGRMVRIPLDS